MPIRDMFSHSISKKITAAILLVVIGVVGGFEWYQQRLSTHLAEQELNDLAERTLTRLTQNLELPLWEVDGDWVKEIVVTEMKNHNVYVIVVKGEGDIVIAKSRDSQWQTSKDNGEIAGDLVVRTATVYRAEEQIGDVTLYISKRFMQEDLREDTIHALVETLFLTLFLILFLTLILNRIVILPLREILKTAQSIAAGEYGRNILLKQRDEIGLLADEFNHMKANVHQRETERDRAQAMLEQDKERTKAQLDLTLANFESERTLINYAVDECTRITQSQLGYLHFFDSEHEAIHAYAWSHGFLDCGNLIEKETFPLADEGVWADAIRQKHSRIKNTFTTQATEEGRLSSYLTLARHMCVPIISSGQVVALAGVCNKEGPYSEADAEILSLYVNTLWYLVEKGRANEELSQLRHYLQNIIDSMPSVLVGVELDGTVTHWNLGAEQFSGVDAAAAQGKLVDKILPLLSMQMQAVYKAISEGQPQRMERVTHTKDGERHFADIVVYPLVTNAHVGAVIRIDDITERVRVEEMMVQTEKMMSVGGLAAGMAHEINNPLGGIIQGQQNIRRRLSPDMAKNRAVADELGLDLEKVQRYLERRDILHFLDEISNAGDRAATIVDNMLHFSRKDVKKQPVNIAVLLDQVLELAAVDYDLKKKYDFRSIEVRRDYEAELPKVPCIGSEIQQVILNILRNSAQALQEVRGREEGGRITIRAAIEGKRVRIDIEDNGPGMSEEIRHRVFEPFFTTKPPGQGTGLGLSVSYFIITDTHGGEMQVESEPGKGTKLSLLLPVD